MSSYDGNVPVSWIIKNEDQSKPHVMHDFNERIKGVMVAVVNLDRTAGLASGD